MKLEELPDTRAFNIYKKVKESPFSKDIKITFHSPLEMNVSYKKGGIFLEDDYWFNVLLKKGFLLKFRNLKDAIENKNCIESVPFNNLDRHCKYYQKLEKIGWYSLSEKECFVLDRFWAKKNSKSVEFKLPEKITTLQLIFLDYYISENVKKYMKKKLDVWFTGATHTSYFRYEKKTPPLYFPYGFWCNDFPFLVNDSQSLIAKFDFYKKAIVIEADDEGFVEAFIPPSQERINELKEL